MNKTKKNPLSSTSSSSSSSSSRVRPSATRMSLAATRSMAASMGKSMALAGGKRRKGRKGRRSRRGGDGAAEYVLGQYGNGDAQWDAVFKTGNPAFGNEIINQQHPSSVQAMAHKGGKRKSSSSSRSSSSKSRSRRSKRGGYWGHIINQALVPFGLLGMQNAYAKRTKKNRK